jgi:hypothetical protein
MSGSDEFEELFDSSILQSLEGALNDISLQLQSTEEKDDFSRPTTSKNYYDDYNTEDDDDDDDDNDMETDDDDDAYTYSTYETDFTSDEDEDPDTGEEDLYAMMDNLVAELQMDMDNLDTEEKIIDGPVVIEEEEQELQQQESSQKHINTSPDCANDDLIPIAIDTSAPAIDHDEGAGQDRRNLQRAKSLWKVLSVLAQPDEQGKKQDEFDLDATPKAGNQKKEQDRFETLDDDDTEVAGESTKCDEIQSLLATATADLDNLDNVPVSDYTNLSRSKGTQESSARASYVPSKQDFQQLVGVLADFSRSKRRLRIQEDRILPEEDRASQEIPDLTATPSDTTFDKISLPREESPDYVRVSDYSPMRKPPRAMEPRPVVVEELVEELTLPDIEHFARTEGERKKTSRAIANFTLKKRREYMQRKSKQSPEELENTASADAKASTTEHTATTAETDDVATTPERKPKNRSTSPSQGTPSSAGLTPNSSTKKRRKRTNKHRKGRPKKIVSGHQAPLAAGQRQPSAPRMRVRTRQDYQTKDEVVRALAETEIWHWLINQVRVPSHN